MRQNRIRFSCLSCFTALCLIGVVLLLSTAAHSCEPVLLDDFSLEKLHQIFEVKMDHVNVDLKLMDEALKSRSFRDLDRALVNLIVDWINVAAKYDHWITTNIEGKEETLIAKKSLTWLGAMKAVGKRVNSLNWLLVENDMAGFRKKLLEVKRDFSLLLSLVRKSVKEGKATVPAEIIEAIKLEGQEQTEEQPAQPQATPAAP